MSNRGLKYKYDSCASSSRKLKLGTARHSENVRGSVSTVFPDCLAVGESNLRRIMQIYHSYREFLTGSDSAEWWGSLFWKHSNVVTCLGIWRDIGRATREENMAQRAWGHWTHRGSFQLSDLSVGFRFRCSVQSVEVVLSR